MGRKRLSRFTKFKRKAGLAFKGKDTYTVIGIVLLVISLLSFIGVFIHIQGINFLYIILGWGLPIFAVFSFLLALRFLGTKNRFNTFSTLFGMAIFTISILGFINAVSNPSISLYLSEHGKLGGAVGYLAFHLLDKYLAGAGTIIILIPFIVVSFLMSLSFSFAESLRSIKWALNTTFIFIGSFFEKDDAMIHNNGVDGKIKNLEFEVTGVDDKKDVSPQMIGGDLILQKKPEVKNVVPATESDAMKPHFDNWQLPPIEFLNEIKRVNNINPSDIKKNSEIIERTLASFGITSKVVDVSSGPVVTRYALQITMGTKVSKINNLDRDIALALAAPSGSVRIEAPIPGTSLVGIEMPNTRSQAVALKNIIDTQEFQNMSLTLPIAMGEDVSGKIIIRDLTSMPHLLIAGSTGSGKSMLINSILMGLLYRHSPDTLKFILVDPKHVELSVYNGIPHLLTPVITDMENVNNALKWAVKEMDTRYQLLKEDGARNIAGYNANKEREGKLSNIVVIIDEMADLMLTKGIEVENSIVRLAQMARAVGIHLVLATQRPSVNVITGIIKANIPARIALSVASVIDCRVILDELGAETLLGRGDMLFKSPDMGKTIRVQGALVTEEEISRVIKFISEQGTAEYNESVLTPQRDSNSLVSENGAVLSEDNLFPDAVRIVVAAKRGSASILQSKLKIGYARAARLILELEEKGVVGPQDGSKPRDVLIQDAESFLSNT